MVRSCERDREDCRVSEKEDWEFFERKSILPLIKSGVVPDLASWISSLARHVAEKVMMDRMLQRSFSHDHGSRATEAEEFRGQ